MIEANTYVAKPYKLGGEFMGQWGLTIELRRFMGHSIDVQHVTPHREFPSEEAARQYAAGFYEYHFG